MIRLKSATLDGIKASVVEVECSFTKALPSFSIVGSVTNDIQESKERMLNFKDNWIIPKINGF